MARKLIKVFIASLTAGLLAKGVSLTANTQEYWWAGLYTFMLMFWIVGANHFAEE